MDIQENLVYQLIIRRGTSPDIKTEQGNALGEKSKADIKSQRQPML